MFLTLALLAAAPANAAGFQSTAVLDTIVGQFTGKPVGELGGARTTVDPRLKLAACPAPQLSWLNDAEDAVVVRCMAPAWRIYVPVNALPKARPEPVAAAPRPVIVKAEPIIRRGDPVTVQAGSAGFSITQEGIAVGDAVPGGRLLVRTDEKRPPIQTVAIEPGLARLPGWGR